jgi:hypothetical protein
VDPKISAEELQRRLPGVAIDVREPFYKYWQVEQFEQLCASALISDPKQPFHKQPSRVGNGLALHDGFVLQRLLCSLLPEEECGLDHIHVIITEKLVCTFDEIGWRYHARTIIGGTPSIISLTGIVEAPAKPKEYYYSAYPGPANSMSLKKQFAGRFIDYEDSRLNSALTLYLYQAIFFFITDGEPFCQDERCLLYNPHWQEELIRNLSTPCFCSYHDCMLQRSRAKLTK